MTLPRSSGGQPRPISRALLPAFVRLAPTRQEPQSHSSTIVPAQTMSEVSFGQRTITLFAQAESFFCLLLSVMSMCAPSTRFTRPCSSHSGAALARTSDRTRLCDGCGTRSPIAAEVVQVGVHFRHQTVAGHQDGLGLTTPQTGLESHGRHSPADVSTPEKNRLLQQLPLPQAGIGTLGRETEPLLTQA